MNPEQSQYYIDRRGFLVGAGVLLFLMAVGCKPKAEGESTQQLKAEVDLLLKEVAGEPEHGYSLDVAEALCEFHNQVAVPNKELDELFKPYTTSMDLPSLIFYKKAKHTSYFPYGRDSLRDGEQVTLEQTGTMIDRLHQTCQFVGPEALKQNTLEWLSSERRKVDGDLGQGPDGVAASEKNYDVRAELYQQRAFLESIKEITWARKVGLRMLGEDGVGEWNNTYSKMVDEWLDRYQDTANMTLTTEEVEALLILLNPYPSISN